MHLKGDPAPRQRLHGPMSKLVMVEEWVWRAAFAVRDVVAVVDAAAFLWLGVGYLNRRERWAKRALLILVAMAVLYPLSFGPACAAWDHEWISEGSFHFAYDPLVGFL